MDKETATAILEAAEWKFASTMPKNPHWYILEKAWPDDEEWAGLVDVINTHGKTEVFKGREYTVFQAGGFAYWAMEVVGGGSGIINRKRCVRYAL